MVVAGRDVGHQRAERVERRLVAELVFLLDLHLDLVHRDVAGAFDHHLHVVLPGVLGQLAERLQLGELGFVAGVGDAAGAQAVAQGEAHVVLLEDLADVVEVLVQEFCLWLCTIHCGQDRAAAADDAGDALGGQRQVLHQHAGVDGHVVDALLGLLLDHVEHHVCVQVFDALHARDALRRSARCRSGTGEASMMASRMSWMSPPVERSITVSAP